MSELALLLFHFQCFPYSHNFFLLSLSQHFPPQTETYTFFFYDQSFYDQFLSMTSHSFLILHCLERISTYLATLKLMQKKNDNWQKAVKQKINTGDMALRILWLKTKHMAKVLGNYLRNLFGRKWKKWLFSSFGWSCGCWRICSHMHGFQVIDVFKIFFPQG